MVDLQRGRPSDSRRVRLRARSRALIAGRVTISETALFALGVVFRGVSLVCVLTLVGVAAFRHLARRVAIGGAVVDGWQRDLERTLAACGLTAGVVLVVADVGRLWHQTYAFWGGFEPISTDLMTTIANDTTWGWGWKLQIGFALVATVTMALAPRLRFGGWTVAALAAAAVAWVRPLTGHAMEQDSWLSLPAILQGVHVLAAALWIGTLLVMISVGFRQAGAVDDRLRARLVADLVARFSPLALGSAVALFVAGSATSFMYLGGFEAIYGTLYGQVLALKVVAFGGVAALGYCNWRRVNAHLEPMSEEGAGGDAAAQALLRTARAELAVAALVLVITAALVALPMPMG